MTTPVEAFGDVLVKRDDLCTLHGHRGGKVRTCGILVGRAAGGVVTAGSRHSPQVEIVAGLAYARDLPCSVHVPAGAPTPAIDYAESVGAIVNRHRPGYNTVIVKRAHDDAVARGWTEIPFGMECAEAVEATASQVQDLPWGRFDRIVVPVGSGMTLAGILHGLVSADTDPGPFPAVLGVYVGANPAKRLVRWAPLMWERLAELRAAPIPYHCTPSVTNYHGLELDPVYEAKCIPFLRPRDLFWVVGRRRST